MKPYPIQLQPLLHKILGSSKKRKYKTDTLYGLIEGLFHLRRYSKF